ncbi:MAG: nucleoside monophosphate kinase [Nanoarchaeota archaeon]|nr:nucleoside monophosphate kinase [Nanoarchaeota archaeon]
MSRILLIGPPGAGKGTQAKTISRELGIPHISTGDIFRRMYSKRHPLGVEAREKYWGPEAGGKLVPDDITIPLVKERLSYEDCKKGFILDGFPRTVQQAISLEKFASLDKVIYLTISDEKTIQRIIIRKQCNKCENIYGSYNFPKDNKCCGKELYRRDDDDPETIGGRLKEYGDKTELLIKYYLDLGKLRTIEGDDYPERVFENIFKLISLPDHYAL